MSGNRYKDAIKAIDDANAADPNELLVNGVARPKEVVFAERMTQWVTTLDPAADEAQLLAARAHHLKRWTAPRSSYPEGRAGYLRWRRDRGKYHAAEVEGILEPLGYEPDSIARVQAIIRKDGLKSDPAVQIHEDALCLVFLDLQLTETVESVGPEKGWSVLVKTMAKMSPRGREVALRLALGPENEALVAAAVEEATKDDALQ